MKRVALFLLFLALAYPARALQQFQEDFEHGLSRWELVASKWILVIDSGDPAHGKVLELTPGGTAVYALIKGSEEWSGVRVEGDVLFAENSHNYMGFIYNYNDSGGRLDMGSIYIKGNGSYIRVNPRWDGNPARKLYEEYRTPLTGSSAIRIGHWQRFKAEIIESVCHFYVGNMETPKVTFDLPELTSGRIGFKPRVVGSSAWIDNITVSSIEEFYYKGPARPKKINYEREKLITTWHVIGPFGRRILDLEADGYVSGKTYVEGGERFRWQPFEADARGAVISGRITESLGGRNRAYFHANLHAEKEETAELLFSSAEELFIWVNGESQGWLYPIRLAWFDFWKNPDHAPERGYRVPVQLRPGDNQLLILVNGGTYAGGGFWVHRRRADGADP